MKQLRDAQRPLLWLGHGIRLAGAVDLIDPLLDHLGVPAIVSWAGADMSSHPLIFGRAGVYGGRAANHIVQQADFILAIGTRLSILQTGYDIEKFAPKAKVLVVDIDAEEAHKFGGGRFEGQTFDAGDYMRGLLAEPFTGHGKFAHMRWTNECEELAAVYPVIEPYHGGPYTFLKRLEKYLKPDAVIVTDSGGALLCSHQVMTIKPPQRLITTTGLGEMGFGLPGAIGASFARKKGEVLCINTDGGMMLNLQELQTIAHHNLPIKIIVFSNDGYGMIRHSQKAMGLVRTASDKAGGVSCPDFMQVAFAFGLSANWSDNVGPWWMFDQPGPCVYVVNYPADLQYLPKLMGSPGHSPALDELSPMLVPA